MAPEETVRLAEEAHASLDIERMVACFHPDAAIIWNGQPVAKGIAEVRRFYEGFFGEVVEFTLTKTLRAATADTIAVEWVHRRKQRNGDVFDGVAGEFWRMRDDLLYVWHAYCIETKV